jgi:hypothetical protein
MVKVSGRRQVWLVVVAATEEESGGSRGTIQTVAGGGQKETDHISVNTNKNKHYLLACILCRTSFLVFSVPVAFAVIVLCLQVTVLIDVS